MPDVYSMGLDWSIRSPAACLLHPSGHEVSWWCLAPNPSFHRRCPTAIRFKDVTYTITCVLPPKRTDDWLAHSEFCVESWDDWRRQRLPADQKVGCVIEGYAFGVQAGMICQIAEHTAILKQTLRNFGMPLAIVPPTQMKKFATGKGNAQKPALHEKFAEQTGVNLHQELYSGLGALRSPVSDLVDAYFLAKMVTA